MQNIFRNKSVRNVKSECFCIWFRDLFFVVAFEYLYSKGFLAKISRLLSVSSRYERNFSKHIQSKQWLQSKKKPLAFSNPESSSPLCCEQKKFHQRGSWKKHITLAEPYIWCLGSHYIEHFCYTYQYCWTTNWNLGVQLAVSELNSRKWALYVRK